MDGGVAVGSMPRFPTVPAPQFSAGSYQPRTPMHSQPAPGMPGQGTTPGTFQHRFTHPNAMNTFDGKRMRNKAVLRRTIDYNSAVVNYLENRIWQRDGRDRHFLETDPMYSCQMVPTVAMIDKASNCVTTRHIRTSTNKMRCPIFCICWTPEGRRLITGASSGEFTLWNGLTFNFETILQAHDTAVRVMKWSHNDQWMMTADHSGFVKYWQSNMNNVKMYQAHKDPVRGLSFCPTDSKFTSCSDDGTVRIWDFQRCHEERIMRGHGADVKCVDWHPQKSLVASGSKDTQQPLKLWDPRMGESLATIHAHKHTVMELSWNRNGNWLVTASRDHLLKLFDIRNFKEEVQAFRGHKKEATTVAWHPIHESVFVSGGSDGAIMYWMVGNEKELGSTEEAHEMMVWSLAWHPLGHILVSGSNDHTTKFWTRNKPGDRMRDRYNLNLLPQGITEDMLECDAELAASLPGMGLEHGLPDHLKKDIVKPETLISSSAGGIPGLDCELKSAGGGGAENANESGERRVSKRVPFSKPVPRDFQQAWTQGKQPVSIQQQQQQQQQMGNNNMQQKPPQNKNDGMYGGGGKGADQDPSFGPPGRNNRPALLETPMDDFSGEVWPEEGEEEEQFDAPFGAEDQDMRVVNNVGRGQPFYQGPGSGPMRGRGMMGGRGSRGGPDSAGPMRGGPPDRGRGHHRGGHERGMNPMRGMRGGPDRGGHPRGMRGGRGGPHFGPPGPGMMGPRPLIDMGFRPGPGPPKRNWEDGPGETGEPDWNEEDLEAGFQPEYEEEQGGPPGGWRGPPRGGGPPRGPPDGPGGFRGGRGARRGGGNDMGGGPYPEMDDSGGQASDFHPPDQNRVPFVRGRGDRGGYRGTDWGRGGRGGPPRGRGGRGRGRGEGGWPGRGR